MKKTILTVSMLVLMLAGPSWADVVADYSYECNVLPTEAGWTDLGLENDISIVNVDPINELGNKAINWTALTGASSGYVGFNREMARGTTDFTYEMRFQTLGTDSELEWDQIHLRLQTRREGDVGGEAIIGSGSAPSALRFALTEYADPLIYNTTSSLAALTNAHFQKLRIVWDWNAAQTEYDVTWLYDDGVMAGFPGYDAFEGFGVLFTEHVTSPVINTESFFSVMTKVECPDTHNESIDYIRWVDQAVGISEALTPIVIPGDANNDGLVSAGDYACIQSNLGATGPADGTLYGDANADGTVSVGDYASVQTNFDTGAPQVTPEPATMSLLALGGMLLIKRRRKQ